MLRPAWVVVDLAAVGQNLELVRRRIGDTALLAVVKADAYGHGAARVGRFLEERGVEWFGVALAEEGVELRRAGLRGRLLVLGPAAAAQRPLYERYRLTPTVSSREQLELWAQGSERAGGPQGVHLKVDTGMHRLGLAPEELPAALEVVRGHRGLRLEGLLSHLADANDLSSSRTAEQEERFAALTELLTDEERGRVMLHLANSAGGLHHPATRRGLVRAGLSLLGLDPAGLETGLRPAMSVVTRLVQVRRVAAGARPGYGGTWTAPRDSRLGVVPVGYADGYGWRLSNRAHALVAGRRVSVVGAVSMDLTLLDLTGVEAAAGDEVVLLGEQGGERINAWDLARWAGTIPYEVLCLLGLRLPRRYRRAGGEVAYDSRFSSL